MEKKCFNIIVTCVGGRLIYDILAALRAANDFDVRLVGIDADPQAEGRLLCDEFYTLPIAETSPDLYRTQILSLCDKEKIDIIFALSEGESILLSRHHDLFSERGIKLSVSSEETVSVMTDKLLMMQRLEEKNVYTMPFCAVNNLDDYHTALEKFGYGQKKVVIKPRDGRGSRGVLIADASITGYKPLLPNRFCGTGDRETLLEAMEKENMKVENLVAVPYLEGDVFDVDCIALNGKMTDVAARLRQLKNPLSPSSTGHKIRLDQRVLKYAEKLCEIFNVDGAGDFDIALDENGKAVLFDSGARFSGSVGGSFVAGGNFPAQLVRVLTGLPRQEMKMEDNYPIRPYLTMAAIPLKNENDLL